MYDPLTIKRCLEKAISEFNRVEAPTLLCPRKDKEGNDVKKGTAWSAASERAIAHRLAVYLEREIQQESTIVEKNKLVVDCEYNRHLQSDKSHEIPANLVDVVKAANRHPKLADDDRPHDSTIAPEIADEDAYVFSIAPDIILHSRGNDERNLLVVELTKVSNTNPQKEQYDALKLKCFTGRDSDYGYLVGAQVVVFDDVVPEKRELRVTVWFLPEAGTAFSVSDSGSLASFAINKT